MHCLARGILFWEKKGIKTAFYSIDLTTHSNLKKENILFNMKNENIPIWKRKPFWFQKGKCSNKKEDISNLEKAKLHCITQYYA